MKKVIPGIDEAIRGVVRKARPQLFRPPMIPDEILADLDPAEIGNCGCLIPDNDDEGEGGEESDDE